MCVWVARESNPTVVRGEGNKSRVRTREALSVLYSCYLETGSINSLLLFVCLFPYMYQRDLPSLTACPPLLPPPRYRLYCDDHYILYRKVPVGNYYSRLMNEERVTIIIADVIH